MPFEATQMDLEITILREARQRQIPYDYHLNVKFKKKAQMTL